MRRQRRWRVLLPGACLVIWLGSGCGGDAGTDSAPSDEPGAETTGKGAGQADAVDPAKLAGAALAAKLDKDYPLHAVVVGIETRVFEAANSDATVVGWLRAGSSVRLAPPAKQQGADRGCKGRFHRVHPLGFVCDDASLEVRPKPIPLQAPTDQGWKNGQVEKARSTGAVVVPPAARDAVLPYDYFFVKERAVPEYHRLPSRGEQRAALAKGNRYLELLAKEDKRAAAYLTGEVELGPKGTAITARYLDRGFFVASSGSEVRAKRRFVRTTQGRYIKGSQLETRTGHDFEGVALDAQTQLPIAWTTRTSALMQMSTAGDGVVRFSKDDSQEPLPRQTRLTGWQGRKNLGGHIMHIVDSPAGTRYLKAWFAAVADRIDRPKEVPAGVPWVHVDLSEQTLVLYEGDTPVYATLVSTGVEGNGTPVGVYEIRKKRITDTMANIGPEAGDDRYRIEDVPHVQYFEGSFALHAAFWHTRFGLPRSHGCVNLAPKDAHRVFHGTLPAVPAGFHGVSTEETALRGSYVVVTE